jgi:positive regulator of sigma E activity
MALLLYVVGLFVFVAGFGWLASSLGVSPAIVNTTALVLLVGGVVVGITRMRLADRT